MKIKELIEKLKQYDPNNEAWIEDSEYGLLEFLVRPANNREHDKVMAVYNVNGNTIEEVVRQGDCVLYSL